MPEYLNGTKVYGGLLSLALFCRIDYAKRMNAIGHLITPITPRRSALVSVATLLPALLPLVIWVANRAAPLALVLAALALVGGSAMDGRLLQDIARLRQALFSRAGLSVLAFLIFALVSVSWSHLPLRSLRIFGELLVPLVAGFIVAMLWPRLLTAMADRQQLLLLVAGALILGCILIMVELNTNMALRIRLGMKPQNYIFNPVLISYLLLGFPVLDGLWRLQDRWSRVVAAVLAVTLAAAIISAESGAAVFGLIIGVAAWLMARILPRLMLATLAAGFLASLVLAPVMGEILDKALPPSAHEGLKNAHSRDRVDIWLSFGEAVRARPLTGAGFGTSAVYDSHPVAAEVSVPRRTLLGVGHPHSLPLQIWAEMGVIGAVLAGLCGLGVVAALAHIPENRRAAPLAMVATALAIATVGHGAWQAWWIAAIAAGVCWFLAGHDARTGELT
jgi:O-antigen ligase